MRLDGSSWTLGNNSRLTSTNAVANSAGSIISSTVSIKTCEIRDGMFDKDNDSLLVIYNYLKRL